MAKKKDEAPDGQVKVRILVDCAHGKCDEVIEIPVEQVESLAGQVDADPAAVAYAESLTAPKATKAE